MKFQTRTILRILACAAVALLLGARPSHAFVSVPLSASIIQVTIPIPGIPNFPGYCSSQSVIEFPDYPGASTYRAVYTHIASGQDAVIAGVPADIVYMNYSGYYHEEHPPSGHHWVPLSGGAFGPDCGTAASYTADDWTNPRVDAWVESTAPIAVIRTTRSTTSSFEVSFDGGGSIAPDSGVNIVKYEWDFGDTKTATGQIVDHTYEHAKVYTVTLKVTDSNAQTASTTVQFAATPALLTLSAGVTNGKIFSVEVSVKNCGKVPLTNTVFKDPQGIFDNGTGDPAARADIEFFEGPNPPLPSALAPNETYVGTVAFSIEGEGEVQIQSTVTGTDDTGRWNSGARAQIQIGKRRLTTDELNRIMADTLMDSSQAFGRLLNAAKIRLGQIVAWAASPQGGETAPPWLTTSLSEPIVVPPGTTFEAPPWINTTAGRAMALDDHIFSYVPDNTNEALAPIAAFADHYATAGGKVIDESVDGAIKDVRYAADFYGQLASGDDAFRAEAQRQFNALTAELGEQTGKTVTIIGALLSVAEDDPYNTNLERYQNNPVVQEFQRTLNETADASLKAVYDKTAHLVQLAKTDPQRAGAELGDLLGTELTKLTRDAVLTEVGVAGVSKLAKVIDGALPFARNGAKLDAALPVLDPKVAALLGSTDGTSAVIGRRALESFADGATITPAQLQQLGGFYGQDAEALQKIITDINDKYKIQIEIQVRPGNPASIPYYEQGLGVPKPEWIKPKNTEYIDVKYLGAPPDSLGKATVFKPVEPSAAMLAPLTPVERETVVARFKSQEKLYKDARTEGGKFFKLLEDSKKPEGATYTVGLGAGKRDITGLKYRLDPVGEDAFVVIDEAAGGKFVLSDADYQAVVDAETGKHLPADVRGQIETELMYRLGRETVSFGGHGYSHSGFDLASKFSEVFMQFATEQSSPAAARRAWEWFVARRYEVPDWLTALRVDEAVRLGRLPTDAEMVDVLLKRFQPGNFVVKFNGTNFRVGYGAGLR